VIALIVTPEGFPIAYEMLPGNTSDKTTKQDARSNALQLPSRPAGMVSGWRAGSGHAASKPTLSTVVLMPRRHRLAARHAPIGQDRPETAARGRHMIELDLRFS
jgi:hypothetical protein